MSGFYAPNQKGLTGKEITSYLFHRDPQAVVSAIGRVALKQCSALKKPVWLQSRSDPFNSLNLSSVNLSEGSTGNTVTCYLGEHPVK